MNQSNLGKVFEREFKKSAQSDKLFIYRLKDSVMSYTQIGSVFTPTNMCDFFIYNYPYLFALELKHTTYGSMSIQTSDKEDDNRMIKYHQIKEMTEAVDFNGVKAGFILSFENQINNKENTFFIAIQNFNLFLKEQKKKSINMIDIIQYNGIKITQDKKIKYYYYHIKDLLEQI